MEKVAIEICKYYGEQSFYSVMPESVFDSLELAFLKGEEFADVPKNDYEQMMLDYNKKMNDEAR